MSKAADMARFALAHVSLLGQRASVNRPTSARMSVYSESPADEYIVGRKAMVIEYEAAISEGRPMSDTPDMIQLEPEPHWGSSLRSGPWREPGHCAAYPQLTSHLYPNLSYRTIEVELAAANEVARETIFARWPH